MIANEKFSETERNDAKYLIDGVDSYVSELEKLLNDVNLLKNDKDEVFKDFNGDIPSSVKVARNKRNQAKFKKPI